MSISKRNDENGRQVPTAVKAGTVMLVGQLTASTIDFHAISVATLDFRVPLKVSEVAGYEHVHSGLLRRISMHLEIHQALIEDDPSYPQGLISPTVDLVLSSGLLVMKAEFTVRSANGTGIRAGTLEQLRLL